MPQFAAPARRRAVLVPRRALGLPAAALVTLAACGDTTAPTPADEQRLTITAAPQGSAGGLEGKQLSLAPGDSTRLVGQFQGSRGGQPSGVAWSSSNAAVAEVDASGLVRARTVGTAAVVATAGRSADTVSVVVSRCGTTRALALAVGQVQTFDVGQGGELCVPAGSAGEEYALVPYFATDSAKRTAGLTVTASGTVVPALLAADAGPLTGGALTSRLDGPSLAVAGTDGTSAPEVTDAPVRQRLARLTRRELAPRFAGAREAMRAGRRAATAFSASRAPNASGAANAAAAAGDALQAQAAQAAPRVGDVMRLNTRTTSACDTVSSAFRTGRVAAVSERAIIVADVDNPTGGFTATDYQNFAAAFDTLAWPVDVQAFGEPSDLDRNRRVVIFFTREVNALTPRSANYIVGGFFWERDLFPRNASRAADRCAGSNEAEMFYMLVPDPSGTINGNRRTLTYVRGVTIGTIAHEFQHLINAGRRLYVTDAPDFEDAWLNEGLSHIAEELVFYRASGLAARGRLDYERITGTSAVNTAWTDYGTDNFRRLVAYLAATETRSPFADDDDLETRGAAWQFLRYAADRLGGRELDLWQRLVANKTTGRANLQAALGGVPLDDWLRDWAVANYVDGLVTTPNARFSFPSWSFRSIIPRFRDQLGRPYVLGTRTLEPGAAASVTLNGGSAAYLRFAVPANGQATIRTRVDAGRAVRLSVVRTR